MIEFISILAGDYYSGYKNIFINPKHIVRIEPDADKKAMLCFDNGEFIHTPYNMSKIMEVLSGENNEDHQDNSE